MTVTHNDIDKIKIITDKLYYTIKKNGYLFSVCFSKNHVEFKKIKIKKSILPNLVKAWNYISFMNYSDIKNLL